MGLKWQTGIAWHLGMLLVVLRWAWNARCAADGLEGHLGFLCSCRFGMPSVIFQVAWNATCCARGGFACQQLLSRRHASHVEQRLARCFSPAVRNVPRNGRLGMPLGTVVLMSAWNATGCARDGLECRLFCSRALRGCSGSFGLDNYLVRLCMLLVGLRSAWNAVCAAVGLECHLGLLCSRRLGKALVWINFAWNAICGYQRGS